MIIKKRFAKLPSYVIEEQKIDPITRDLYLSELTEFLIRRNTLWSENIRLDNHLLIFCTKGSGTIQIANDSIPFNQNQYCIIPQGFLFKIQTNDIDPSIFLTCKFNGEKTKIMEKDFTVIRDLIPSVNNMVANRIMLFDELFNNLTKGFYNANYQYINFCFGHLLATFCLDSSFRS